MDVRKSIHAFLSTKTSLTNLLKVYQFTTGVDSPALFTSKVMPKDAKYPAVFITEPHKNGSFGCRGQRGAELGVDIRVFGDHTTSDAELRAVGEEVWDLMDRADMSTELAANGMEDWGCVASTPQPVTDEDGFPGYLVQVTVRVLENP